MRVMSSTPSSLHEFPNFLIKLGLTQLEVPGLVVRRFIAVQTRNELRDYEPFA